MDSLFVRGAGLTVLSRSLVSNKSTYLAGSNNKPYIFRWFEYTPPPSIMSRSAASPRVFQPYSPRYPSPLGLPPLAAPQGSQDIPCSAYPKTPERYYYQHYSEPTSHGMRFPPDVHRRTSNTQRARASPPAPLSLDSHHHPAAFVHLPSIEETLQPHAKQEMHVPPPSPTASSTSSLSLYSTESAKKSLEIGEGGEGEGKKKGGGGGGVFCLCFSTFLLSIYSLTLQLIDFPFYF